MRERPKPRYKGYVFDLDGTIYLGDRLISGSREVVKRLRDFGCSVVFVSNKPLEPRSSYAAKLTRLGIRTPVSDVINSTQALIRYLREHCPAARLFVIGEEPLLEELERCARGLGGQQRVNDDPAGLAAHEGDVRQVEASHLVDAGDHLIETVILVELADPVERGMDRLPLLVLVQEVESGLVPGYVAGIGHDLPVRHLGDEALLLLVEIAGIGEGKRLFRLFQNL